MNLVDCRDVVRKPTLCGVLESHRWHWYKLLKLSVQSCVSESKAACRIGCPGVSLRPAVITAIPGDRFTACLCPRPLLISVEAGHTSREDFRNSLILAENAEMKARHLTQPLWLL